MVLLTIKFYPNQYEVEKRNIEQGLSIIPTEDSKYVLIAYTPDGDLVEIYNSFKELVKKIKEYYGDEIAEAVKNNLGVEEEEEEEES